MKAEATSPVGLTEAQALVEGAVRVLAPEQVALADALGRILRCDVVSDVDLPPSDVSVMDGFCLDSASTREASASRPVHLRVSGTVRAGETASARVGPGECMAIMTGAPLPAGADAVVSTEEVGEPEWAGGTAGGMAGGESDRQGVVCVRVEVEPGRWVRKRAEVISRGDPVPVGGRRATPQMLGLLASLGVDPVSVARRPIVGVVATGDELVGVKSCPGSAALRASNLPMLLGLARAAGCEAVDGGISGDDEASIADGLERCRACDAVIVSGGASGGKFDLVAKVLVGIGVRPVFREIRMGPGRRTLFGIRDGVAFFSLPGTPAAALTTFHLIVKPGLLAMMGASLCRGQLLRARIGSPLVSAAGSAHPRAARTGSVRGGFTRVVAARWVGGAQAGAQACARGGGGCVQPLAMHGGGDVVTLSDATCFIVLAEDKASVEAGDEVDVLVLEGE